MESWGPSQLEIIDHSYGIVTAIVGPHKAATTKQHNYLHIGVLRPQAAMQTGSEVAGSEVAAAVQIGSEDTGSEDAAAQTESEVAAAVQTGPEVAPAAQTGSKVEVTPRKDKRSGTKITPTKGKKPKETIQLRDYFLSVKKEAKNNAGVIT